LRRSTNGWELHIGYCLDLVDIEYSEIGFPSMKLEQRIMIGADRPRNGAGLSHDAAEHTADDWPVEHAGMDGKPTICRMH
jgi:hypothetical protein